MTRESLKDQYQLAKTDVAPLIDKIYDEFESKTCENCKHLYTSKAKTYTGGKTCNAGVVGNVNNGEVWNTFGCSKFERREL